MKALILNSGLGSRMGDITKKHPKCMTKISGNETILSRQLRLLDEVGVKDIIITTGYFDQVLIDYCESLKLNLNLKFVKNPLYDKTNYIYSIYCAKNLLLDDIILLHGDLIFEKSVLYDVMSKQNSSMKVSSTAPLPEKDFKAVVKGNRVQAVGIDYFDNAMEAQALYKINRKEWVKWLNNIIKYCNSGNTKCYAEDAFNEVSSDCHIYACDVKDSLCMEIDNLNDLEIANKKLEDLLSKKEKEN